RRDADLESADQRKRAARDAELLGDGLEKNAERARKRECAGDVDEYTDADDVPAVEKLEFGGAIVQSYWVSHSRERSRQASGNCLSRRATKPWRWYVRIEHHPLRDCQTDGLKKPHIGHMTGSNR